MIHITRHAYEKAKERLSWKRKTLDRMAPKAFNEGIKHSETKSHLHKWVSKKYLRYGRCNNIRIYGENVYFFDKYDLVTLYRLPNNLGRELKISREAKA